MSHAPELKKVAARFKLLAEPARLVLLKELEKKACCVKELTELTDIRQPSVSKQLRILVDAGVVERSRQGSGVFFKITDKEILKICRLVCEQLEQSF